MGLGLKKEREAKITSLMADIHRLEMLHKQTPTLTVERDLLTTRRQIIDLFRYKAKRAIRVGKKQSYEYGNKCGKQLADSLREQQLRTYVPMIMGTEGERYLLPREIAQRFGDFYSALYNLRLNPQNQNAVEEYVSTSGLPSLASIARQELEKPITLEEVHEAVNLAKMGKAPGPDGFTAQYYKLLFPILGPYLVKMYNGLGDSGSFQMESLKALITILPKEGKDPSQCGSYRPISLLNADLKLFSKILAMRLQQYLPSLVHLDQVGFVQTREARDNTIRTLNLIHIANTSKIPSLFLGTDAEKAFDRINWQFMFAVLRQVGMGNNMIRWISSIYTQPSAQVKVNGVLSQPFNVTNGTRQ